MLSSPWSTSGAGTRPAAMPRGLMPLVLFPGGYGGLVEPLFQDVPGLNATFGLQYAFPVGNAAAQAGLRWVQRSAKRQAQSRLYSMSMSSDGPG